MKTRYTDISHGDHFIFSHKGADTLVFVLEDNQGVKCLYSGDGSLVAEVFADDSIEFV